MKHRILTVSSANLDLDAKLRAAPQAGQTVIGTEYFYVPGGKGANSAVTVARLGFDSILCARLGKDSAAERLLALYRAEGIDTRFIARDSVNPTGLALILIEESGQNRIVVYPGANMALSPSDAEYAFTAYPDALLMQLEIGRETILWSAEKARRQGIPVIVDAGPAVPDFPLEKLGPVDIFSPNESECAAYTGITPSGADSCFAACMALEKRIQAKYYVLKLGGRGCYVYDGKYCRSFAPYEVDVVDTTAAGDAFTAALTVEYLSSGSISRAAVFANVVGSLTVSKSGASSSIPTLAEVRRFMGERDIRLK
ncbi:MAG: ribokinase [Eubacteriales bacterium]|jgi:ribokinase